MLSAAHADTLAAALATVHASFGRLYGVAPVADGDLRLRHSLTGGRSGRLEIWRTNRWGVVCGSGFGKPSATVACRQLGFNAGAVSDARRPPRDDTTSWLKGVQCLGTESRLDECPHGGWGPHDCLLLHAAVVDCTPGVPRKDNWAMEVEFKVTAEDRLAIKQVRPWVY